MTLKALNRYVGLICASLLACLAGCVTSESDLAQSSDTVASDPARSECDSNLDCPIFRRCLFNVCAPICSSDAECLLAERCVLGVCGPAEICDDDCSQTSCTPGERWCEGGPWYCADNGQPLPASACAPGSFCIEGECAPVTCDGDHPAVCDGDQLVVCDVDAEVVTALVDCTAGFECRDAACRPSNCQLGEMACRDRGRYICEAKADGTLDWQLVEQCDQISLCEPDSCVLSPSCALGERFCDGNDVVRCTAETGRFQVQETCLGTCDQGSCVAPECEPNTSWCSNDTALACSADGDRTFSMTCGPDAACASGACLPEICEIAERRCDNQGNRQICGPDSTLWLPLACEAGQMCIAGACYLSGTRLHDGAACDIDSHCSSGACLRGTSFPDGYCSAESCDSEGDCVGGGRCHQGPLSTYCVDSCDADVDCRSGYSCAADGLDSFCRATRAPGPFGVDFPFHTNCDSQLIQEELFDDGSDLRAFPYRARDPATGFLATLYHTSGEMEVIPWEISHAEGEMYDLARQYPIFGANADLDGPNAVLLPSSPSQVHLVRPGEVNSLLFTAPDNAVCAYFVPTSPSGDRIDLNLITVGVAGTFQGPGSAAFDEMLEHLDSVFDISGFRIGTVRLDDVDAVTEARFSVMRGLDDMSQLMAQGRVPGPTVEDALSIDIFLVRDILDSAAIGVSGGLPGAAGLHGFPGSGIVVSTATLEANPQSVARIMAHEIGHFLGLAHTTEVWGESIEPIEDTSDCSVRIILHPEGCPDADNLMFPYALSQSQQLSEDQRWVFRNSPLTR